MRAFGLVCVVSVLACGGDSTTTNDGGLESGADGTAFEAGKDVSTDVAADAPCVAPTTTFYVDAAKGSDTNSGGATCAFKTITAALTASKTVANATINVAAGSYGAGETFPLIVDHGRSLVGAGASSTTIQGSSATYNTTGTNSFLDSGMHFVTLLAGDVIGGTDSLTASTISGLTILPASTVTTPTTNYVGIACISGNAPNTGTTTPLPAASLVLKGLTVGPNFDSGVVVGASPTLKVACNAEITTSTITGANSGIIAGACGVANPDTSWPSAQIGDGQTADGNTFAATAIGVFVQGCGSAQSINNNKFNSGFRGIVLISQSAQYIEILANTFDGTAAPAMGMGINTNASAVINKLNDNTFTNISESTAADTAVSATTGYALALGGGNVLQAQRNSINNNDNGVYLGGTLNANFDFSDDGNAVNGNKLYCNSKTVGGSGYDLIFAETSATPANFQGNQWDHATPSTSISLTTSANGTDIVTGTSVGANTTGAGTAITTACATGRVH